MTPEAFASRTELHCDKYLRGAQEELDAGHLQFRDSTSGARIEVGFPTHLNLFTTPEYFCAELLGAAERHAPLKVSKTNLDSERVFLGHFEPAEDEVLVAPAMRYTDCTAIRVEGFAVMGATGLQEILDRYPFIGDMSLGKVEQKGPLTDGQVCNALSIPGTEDIWLKDVLCFNATYRQIRARYFQVAWLVRRDIGSSEYSNKLRYFHPNLTSEPLTTEPTRTPDPKLLRNNTSLKSRNLTLAANFASIANIRRLREPTITSFIESNASLLTTALKSTRIIPQPQLDWIDPGPDPEDKSIRPDFLFVDSDGLAHICDFKLPLLDTASLTVNPPKHRRFRANVSKGIGQLVGYERYFKNPKHKELLQRKYGCTIAPDPRLLLVVGSWENYLVPDAWQALRSEHPAIEVLDFDTLRCLYLINSGLALQ